MMKEGQVGVHVGQHLAGRKRLSMFLRMFKQDTFRLLFTSPLHTQQDTQQGLRSEAGWSSHIHASHAPQTSLLKPTTFSGLFSHHPSRGFRCLQPATGMQWGVAAKCTRRGRTGPSQRSRGNRPGQSTGLLTAPCRVDRPPGTTTSWHGMKAASKASGRPFPCPSFHSTSPVKISFPRTPTPRTGFP